MHLAIKHPSWCCEKAKPRARAIQGANVFKLMELQVQSVFDFNEMEVIVMDNESGFEYVERDVYAKVVGLVKQKIKSKLPPKFGLMVEFWEQHGYYYFGYFALFENVSVLIDN